MFYNTRLPNSYSPQILFVHVYFEIVQIETQVPCAIWALTYSYTISWSHLVIRERLNLHPRNVRITYNLTFCINLFYVYIVKNIRSLSLYNHNHYVNIYRIISLHTQKTHTYTPTQNKKPRVLFARTVNLHSDFRQMKEQIYKSVTNFFESFLGVFTSS